MNRETGQFVDEAQATVDMNRYSSDQLIVITGDVFRVVQVKNLEGRGQLVLRALNRLERDSAADDIRKRALKAYKISPNSNPTNRAERRKAAHDKRRKRKRGRS